MPLSSGDKLGPYKIVVPIGAGGMGQVYKARDTRLGRDVAIKVLPDAFRNQLSRNVSTARPGQPRRATDDATECRAFLDLWKCADPDLRPLTEARQESAALH